MKISNEAKIGALTLIAITLLILGFNFLKGKSFFGEKGVMIYATYLDTKELTPSNFVFVNGFQVGNIAYIIPASRDLHTLIVAMRLKEHYYIPKNSIAYISTSPIGNPSIYITLGSAHQYLLSGDTMQSSDNPGVFASFSEKVLPVADQLQGTLKTMDSVLKNVNTTLDPSTKNNLQSVIANLNKTTQSLFISSTYLQNLLNSENGAMAKSLRHINSFTENLASNNDKINSTLANLQTTTEHLSKADIEGVVKKLNATIDDLKSAMAKLNSPNGSLGALINDKQLYNNLNNSVTSLHTLIDDLRVHPKRYVNISVFGKKDKGDYLTAPLKTDTTTSK